MIPRWPTEVELTGGQKLFPCSQLSEFFDVSSGCSGWTWMCYRASADPMSSWGCTSTDDGLSRTIVFFPHLLCTDDLVVHKHNGVQLHHAETYFMYWSNANISCYSECCTNFRTNRFESRLMNRGICQDKNPPQIRNQWTICFGQIYFQYKYHHSNGVSKRVIPNVAGAGFSEKRPHFLSCLVQKLCQTM